MINVRSFGEDPQDVARYVAAFVRGVQSAGVIATAKHFPGTAIRGRIRTGRCPVLAASRDRLERVELVPFRAAIGAGVRAVMTAHLAVPALDRDAGSRCGPAGPRRTRTRRTRESRRATARCRPRSRAAVTEGSAARRARDFGDSS